MSKKMMKRSLVLGSLMAFVITGSAMAAENFTEIGSGDLVANTFSEFKSSSGLDGVDKTSWTALWPNNTNFEISDKLVTTGDIEYKGGPLGLYAAYRIENLQSKIDPRLDNPNNNVLEIKHNLTATGEINIYAAFVGYGKDDPECAMGNVTLVGDSEKKIKIMSENSGVYIGGAVSQNPRADAVGRHDVTGNKVIIKNVIFEGSKIGVFGAKAVGGNAENNEVTIVDTTIENALISGGVVQTSGGGNTSGNTVNIEGNSKIAGEIYGGYHLTSSGSVCNNTIILKDAADVSSAKLYGSNKEEGAGNKLEFDESYTGGNGGKAINTVGNFDSIKIESADADNPIKIETLNLKEAGESSKGTAIVVEKLQMESGAQEGDSVKLFEAQNTTGDIDSENSKATVYVGTAEMGTASVGGDLQNSGINLTVEKLDMNPQVLVIGESRAAATAFVNQGSELVETGLDALARDNAKAGAAKVFAAVYGNASEYATGSHVKVNGWRGIVGVGKTNDNGLTVGAFFENGDGNYRTYNVNAGIFMRGDGEAVYNGGGLLIRKDNANGVYTEASLRAGNLKNELKNAVMGKAGLDGYDVDTFYYGAHVGIGKVIPRGDEGDSIDVYGKFMYTHHDGETFNIQGDDYKFDSVDSERLRLGFRINEVQTNKLSMYYGAAWEYEFGGDADNKVIGYDLSTPSLEGSTMIGEIGMHYFASEKWSLDLNVRGYSGQRDGFSGSVQANYSF